MRKFFKNLYRSIFGKAARKDTVVSFPKSGRTWLRVMLDQMGYEFSYSHAYSGHRGGRHFSELNTNSAKQFNRIVFLHRDPRDTAVSGFHHKQKRLDGYEGSLSDFIRDPHHGIEKIFRFNQMWIKLAEQREDMIVVSYEELQKNAPEVLARIGTFLGKPVDMEKATSIVEANRFEKMKKREAEGSHDERYGGALKPRIDGDENSFKVRKGKVGGFKDEFTKEDIAWSDELLERLAG